MNNSRNLVNLNYLNIEFVYYSTLYFMTEIVRIRKWIHCKNKLHLNFANEQICKKLFKPCNHGIWMQNCIEKVTSSGGGVYKRKVFI